MPISIENLHLVRSSCEKIIVSKERCSVWLVDICVLCKDVIVRGMANSVGPINKPYTFLVYLKPKEWWLLGD
jgi:hypothetical protein